MSDVRDTNHDGKVSLAEKVKDKIRGHKDTPVLPAAGSTALDSRDLNRDGHVSLIEKMAGTHIDSGSAFNRDLNRDGYISTGERLATASGRLETDEEMHLRLHEEQLAISKREVGAGEVDIRKRVHEQHVSQTVPVMREEVIVERRPLSGVFDPNARIAPQDETLHVALFREEVITEKRVVPIEEVIVRKKEVVDQQVVGATLRSEHIETVQTNALQSSVLTGGVYDARDTNLDGHVSMGEKIKGAALGTSAAPLAANAGALDARDTNRDGHVSMGEKVKGAALGTKAAPTSGDARDTNLDGRVSMGEKIKGAALGTNAIAPKAARG